MPPQVISELFPLPLIVEALDGEETWRVCDKFICRDKLLGEIVVKEGTLTDFGSIPKPLRGLISPTGRYRKPYIIHDYLYTVQIQSGKPVTQKQADDCLLRGMVERDKLYNAISPWYKRKFGLERSIIYLGLRTGGWLAWNEHRKALDATLTLT